MCQEFVRAAWPDGHDRRSRLVFTLRDLPRAAIEEGLGAFLAAARAAPPPIPDA